MEAQTTYEQSQINRMVNELLIKDLWSKTFVRKINQNENSIFKNRKTFKQRYLNSN